MTDYLLVQMEICVWKTILENCITEETKGESLVTDDYEHHLPEGICVIMCVSTGCFVVT